MSRLDEQNARWYFIRSARRRPIFVERTGEREYLVSDRLLTVKAKDISPLFRAARIFGKRFETPLSLFPDLGEVVKFPPNGGEPERYASDRISMVVTDTLMLHEPDFLNITPVILKDSEDGDDTIRLLIGRRGNIWIRESMVRVVSDSERRLSEFKWVRYEDAVVVEHAGQFQMLAMRNIGALLPHGIDRLDDILELADLRAGRVAFG